MSSGKIRFLRHFWRKIPLFTDATESNAVLGPQELPVRAVAVPYEDERGNIRRYGINNTDVAALARWLLDHHPELPIECRRSVLDEGVAA